MIINRPHGFTLVEIIVVLIILGILTTIALPNMFSHIERSQAATEAVPSLEDYKNKMNACIAANGVNSCMTSLSPALFLQSTTHFDYLRSSSNASYYDVVYGRSTVVNPINDPFTMASPGFYSDDCVTTISVPASGFALCCKTNWPSDQNTVISCNVTGFGVYDGST